MNVKIALFSRKTREDFLTKDVYHDTWNRRSWKEGDVFFIHDYDAKEIFGVYRVKATQAKMSMIQKPFIVFQSIIIITSQSHALSFQIQSQPKPLWKRLV